MYSSLTWDFSLLRKMEMREDDRASQHRCHRRNARFRYSVQNSRLSLKFSCEIPWRYLPRYRFSRDKKNVEREMDVGELCSTLWSNFIINNNDWRATVLTGVKKETPATEELTLWPFNNIIKISLRIFLYLCLQFYWKRSGLNKKISLLQILVSISTIFAQSEMNNNERRE